MWTAVAATLLAWVAYIVAAQLGVRPSPGFAVVLFTVAPTFALVAAVVLWCSSRTDGDLAVGWVAAGLVVGFVAMALQLLSFPAVSPDGGPLRTGGNGSSLLYLLYHWSLILAAAAGTVRADLRWRRYALAAGLAAAAVLALDLVKSPRMLRADQSFTPPLIFLEQVTLAAAVLVAIAWVAGAGRRAPAMHAWIGMALAFNAYDTIFNAVAGRRYDNVWWASLSMRVCTYGVLAGTAVMTMLLQSRRHRLYAEAELNRRETELLVALRATGRLLASSEALAAAVGEADVAQVAVAAAREATGGAMVLVEAIDQRTGKLGLLASYGIDQPVPELSQIEPNRLLAGPSVIRTGEPMFTSNRPETMTQLPELFEIRSLAKTVAVAAVPLRLATGFVGALVVCDDQEREWPKAQRQVLAGLADQAAQAMQRASLFERERATADALQRGMLPDRLRTTGGVQATARYLPGAQGMRVGGDWYDSIPLADGRNVLVVGDVMGKGPVAAAVMGRTRAVVHALVAVDPHPLAVLAGLDRVTAELIPDTGFVTMLYVLLDPAGQCAQVARAGHLPLLVATPDGTVTLTDAGGSPALGLRTVNRAVPRGSALIEVPAGSTLAMFTDGLVEDRVTGLDHGLRRLTEMVAAYRQRSLAELADGLLAVEPGAREYDDVCLLLARTEPAPCLSQ